jgi:hypothetical protein
VSQATWSVGHAEGAVQMLVHDDVTTGEGAAPAYLVDPQDQILEADGAPDLRFAPLMDMGFAVRCPLARR